MEIRQMARVASCTRPLSSSYRIYPVPRATLRQFTLSTARFEGEKTETKPETPTTIGTPPTSTTTATATTTNAGSGETAPSAPPAQSSISELFEMAGGSISSPLPFRRSFNNDGVNIANLLRTDLVSRKQPKAINVPPISAPSKEMPRTGPMAGRTVEVTTDLSSALSRLRTIIAQNKVRVDQREQKFHVRPSLKFKRLKSLRHRKRFKDAFKKLVGIAIEMKRKGI